MALAIWLGVLGFVILALSIGLATHAGFAGRCLRCRLRGKVLGECSRCEYGSEP